MELASHPRCVLVLTEKQYESQVDFLRALGFRKRTRFTTLREAKKIKIDCDDLLKKILH